ncbi:MAG: hypothetical protein JNL01_03285 [Bdellovibrionales bacterium]|nr:hypothetical protein [Bdellovibrionales bacterium]
MSILSLTGCFEDPTFIVSTQQRPVVVDNTIDPTKTVCNPFLDNPGHVGSSFKNGIVAKLSYLPEASTAEYYKDLAFYAANATSVDATLFFSDLNVPTRKFDLGFITEKNEFIVNEKGNTLYEYFSIHFESQIALEPGDVEGPYQFALLSDDGSVLSVDTGSGFQKLVDNDGTHPTKFMGAQTPVQLIHGTSVPIKLDYYQGPKFHISVILLWRPWPGTGSGQPPVTDPEQGKYGNSRYFDYTQVPSTKKQAYNDLIARGWKVVPDSNFQLPSSVATNPCSAVPPVLTSTSAIPALTNIRTQQVPFDVIDIRTVTTKLFQNGIQIAQSTQKTGTFSFDLVEGSNTLRLETTNSAGFTSTLDLAPSTLDTIAPTIAILNPIGSSILTSTTISLSGSSNERLSLINANGLPLNISSNETGFNGSIVAPGFGPFSIVFVGTDKAGNVATQTVSITIVNPTPPSLTISSQGTSYLSNTTTINLSGDSDKPLASASVNGVTLSLDSSRKHFTGTYVTPGNGLYTLVITGTDDQGLQASATIKVRVMQTLSSIFTSNPLPKLNFIQSPAPPASGSDYKFNGGGFAMNYGPLFSNGPASPGCSQANQLFSGTTIGTVSSAPYASAFPAGYQPKIPNASDVMSFMGDPADPLNAVKLGWISACQGFDIVPTFGTCLENRTYFNYLTGTFPEDIIINAIPGLSSDLRNFLRPRLNVCTGFDTSGLNCDQIIKFIPILANFVIPGAALLLDNAIAQFILSELLCKDLNCDNPLIANVPPLVLLCLNIKLPSLPDIDLPGISISFGGIDGFGGGTSAYWFGSPGCDLRGCASDFDSGDSNGGLGFQTCGYFKGICGTATAQGQNFDSTQFPELAFSSSPFGAGVDTHQISCDYFTSDPSQMTYGQIFDLAQSSGRRVADVFSSALTCASAESFPGLPQIVGPEIFISSPTAGASVASGSSVQVSGLVNNRFARVRINGTDVMASVGTNGLIFNKSVTVPSDGIITIQAADRWGNITTKSVTLNVVSLSAQTTVSAGVVLSCGIKNEALYCWGNDRGLLGNQGNPANASQSTPVPVTGMSSGVTAVSATNFAICAIKTGALYCWGRNDTYQLGHPTLGITLTTPTLVPGLSSGVTAISTSQTGGFVCAIKSGGAFCWGNNSFGQLGNGTTLNTPTPTQVTGLESGVSSISAGTEFGCAVKNGAAYCWGFGISGQLGTGNNTSSSVPVPVQFLTEGVTQISAAFRLACAVKSGAVHCWGTNLPFGSLGNNSATPTSSTPVAVQGLTNPARQVAVGNAFFACAALTDGTAFCWGNDSSGQLGNGLPLSASGIATQVTGIANATSIAAGDAHACVTSGTETYCWGSGVNGQLGAGALVSSPTPVKSLIP